MTFVRACIEMLDAQSGDMPRLWVMFNPEKLTATKSAQYAEVPIPGRDVPILQYVRGQSETFTLDLFLDSTLDGFNEPTGSVEEYAEAIRSLIMVHPRFRAPPRVRFTWGVGLSFVAVVEQVRREYTLFAQSGVPVRATLAVTFRECDLPLTGKVDTGGLLRSSTQAREGETFSAIANRSTGNPKGWRAIANANPEVDPLDPSAGDQIGLPAQPSRGMP